MDRLDNEQKCGCVEFTFYNRCWINSKINVLTICVLVLSLIAGFVTGLTFSLGVLCCIITLLLYILVKVLFSVVKETLYVITPIGVQFTSINVMGKESVLFIPWHSVMNFVIVEVVVGQQILFYLAIQTLKNSKEGLVILFKDTKPRLASLENMYKVIVRS